MLTNTFKCPIDLYSANETGNKHCSNCNKTVVDLRRQSDEAVEHLAKESGEFCGIIQSNRLSSASIGVTALAASILTLSSALAPFNHLQAQEIKTELTESRFYAISGLVVNESTGEPLSNGTIYWNRRGKTLIKVKTDSLGEFELTISEENLKGTKGYYLSFYLQGFTSTIVEISGDKLRELGSAKIELKESPVVTFGTFSPAPSYVPKLNHIRSGATRVSLEEVSKKL